MVRVCSLQLPLRVHLVQRMSCWLKSSRRFTRRASRARGELVWMTMPSATTLSQEGISRGKPSISTMHSRQAAISLIPLR